VELVAVVSDLDPVLVEGVTRAVETAPDVLGGTEDQLALLFGEIRAAARERRARDDGGERELYL
jgi:hypothetical protein